MIARFPTMPEGGPAPRARRKPMLWPALLGAALVAGCASNPVKPPPPPPPPPLSSLTVAPKADTVNVGSNVTLVATAKDTLGVVLGNVSLTWTSSNTAVATVGSSGTVHGYSEGVARIYVSGGGQIDSADVAVITQRGWFMQQSRISTDLNGVYFLPDRRTGWAVGAAGKILHTSDAGQTWSSQTSNTTFNLNSVWFTDSNNGWAVGATGLILATTDGGQTWGQITSNASETLFDVHFASRDTGWVVGAVGVILRTFDRGASWIRTTPTGFDLNSISFSGTMDGWAVGNGGVILGTHDRGLSWFIVQPAVTGQNLFAVWRYSESHALGGGVSGTAVGTANSPTDTTKWVLDNAGASNNLLGVAFADSSVGYAVGYNSGGTAIILRTDDRGFSWQSEPAGTSFRLKDVFFLDDRNGWIVGRGGVILHTTSGGLP